MHICKLHYTVHVHDSAADSGFSNGVTDQAQNARASSAKGGVGLGGISLPIGSGAWRPREILTFWLGMVHFGIYSDKNSQFTRLTAG